MSKFKTGDRVRLAYTDELDASIGLREGMTGTVLEDNPVPYVRWDGLTTGHDGHGLKSTDPNAPRDVWAIYEDQLEAAPQN